MDLARDEEWGAILDGHPIFTRTNRGPNAVEDHLSLKTLHRFKEVNQPKGVTYLGGRRATMVLKDADLIVAVGSELRMTSLSDTRSVREGRKTYKILHTPNIQFDIQQISLNPSGRLLAVAGASQVAVVVLPRPGFMRLVPSTIDCRSLQIGQFYHAAKGAAAVAKIDWHPWGEAGSTLLILTTDGRLREYDTSIDPDEPLQVHSFVPEKRASSFRAQDHAEREATSFTYGKGEADWAPLTIYGIMKSGDIYAICPYLPKNASVPTNYAHSLECFISAKVEYLEQNADAADLTLSTMYEKQHLYIRDLVQQLPPGTMFPAVTRSVPVHPPSFGSTLLQGPFLLQPAPRPLGDGEATDITYLSFADVEEDADHETERLGVLLVVLQDGRVDVCLDIDKVEARWDSKQRRSQDSPMLAVIESIDLGILSEVSDLDPPAFDLLEGNHPVFHPDPIHDDVMFVYHAFGVHVLNLSPALRSLAASLRRHENDDVMALSKSLATCGQVGAQWVLTTFAVQQRWSSPVIGVTLPNDVYLNYSILMLTAAMRISSFALTMRPPNSLQGSAATSIGTGLDDGHGETPFGQGSVAYVSMLGKEPYSAPTNVTTPLGLPPTPRFALPNQSSKETFMLTPDNMRHLKQIVQQFKSRIRDIQEAYHGAEARSNLQQTEFERQQEKAKELLELLKELTSTRVEGAVKRLHEVQERQKSLLSRSDHVLQTFMQKASPDLSEHETKWFKELKQMQATIAGVGQYDADSLASRTSLLEREYSRLLPSLKELSAQDSWQREHTPEPHGTLGVSQAFELGQRSNRERARISHIEQDLHKLAAKVDVPLSSPPDASNN